MKKYILFKDVAVGQCFRFHFDERLNQVPGGENQYTYRKVSQYTIENLTLIDGKPNLELTKYDWNYPNELVMVLDNAT